ncbi:uncharacterized protein LOC124169386 isoform X2 [Ischnura elegans]|uniref:uncharacterized protein LOC124169386 isoform X2 n=1 Tax=Ischnura elegans TaxID=197161 RepID=UPI001ED8A204|nr:uncharacterized protein LOC124169386 isoform X2 [Ischnura elegans]
MNEGVKRKKAKRIERKKKKIAAFLEVAQLNEDDRKAKKVKTKRHKADLVSESTGDVPATKKSRIDDEPEVNSVSHEGEKYADIRKSPDSSSTNPSLTNYDIIELKKMLWEKKSELLNGTSNSSDPCTGYINKDISELTRILREKRKKYSQIPKFSLKESGTLASFCMSEEHRIPLFMVDIQHLIMWSLLGHHSPFDASRWYTLQKFNKLSHTVVLAVDGISVNDLRSASGFLNLPTPAPDDEPPDDQEPVSDKLFPWKLEFIAPLSYGNTLAKEIATVPLSNSQYEKVIHAYGSLEKALKGKAVYKVFRTMFPVQTGSKSDNSVEVDKDASRAKEKNKSSKNNDKFPRTDLLLSPDQMVKIGYPMPLVRTTPDGAKQPLVVPNEMGEVETKIAGSVGALIKSSAFKEHAKNGLHQEVNGVANGKLCNGVAHSEGESEEDEVDEELYVFTKSSYKEVGPNSPMFAVDCEMCITSNHRSELTRISIVNENLEVVYNTLVKPRRKITNYLTRFSGITEKLLKGVKTRLKDVQRDVMELLPPDAILVGQSLNFDLHAMKMMHPYVIDTSVIFNLTGIRSRRTKLATLSRLFLSEAIQCGGSEGHDSVEDAQAAMKLVLLKLSNSVHFGDAVLSDALAREVSKKSKKNSTDSEMSLRKMKMMEDLQIGKDAAVIGVNDAVEEYKTYISKKKVNGNCMDSNQNEVKPPKIMRFENSSEVITEACEVMLEYHLCIVHISKDSVGERLKTLKKWCKKIVKHSAPNSLCVVVVGGTENSNGACFINLKGPCEEVT